MGTSRVSGPVTVEVRDGIAEVVLQDEARRNSVGPELVARLAEVCATVRQDESVHVVVLRARGRVFSAGGDLDSLLSPAVDPRAVYRGFDALAALPVPVVAAVHAPVIGAGVNFLLACDVVVAAESARFDLRFLDIGIHPGGGYLTRLRERVGHQGAAALILAGDVVDAAEAQRCGLVWRAVADDALDATVARLARTMAGRDRALLRRTKATLRLAPTLSGLRDAVSVEQVAQEWSQARPAHRAAVERLRDQVRSRSTEVR